MHDYAAKENNAIKIGNCMSYPLVDWLQSRFIDVGHGSESEVLIQNSDWFEVTFIFTGIANIKCPFDCSLMVIMNTDNVRT